MKKTVFAAAFAMIILWLVGCAKAPEAAFGASPLTGAPPLTVVFSDSSSNEPIEWLWRFGDGDTSVEQNPTHVYDSTGTYDVTLVVTNSTGTDSLTKLSYIEVGQLGYEKVEVSGMTLEWRSDSANLHIRLSAPTTGWVAVGFNPSSMMKDANFIMGYVVGNDAFISDQFGTAVTSHTPDADLGGSDNVFDSEGTQTGATRITFTIPLDSGDSYDQALVAGQTYKVIVAHGPDGADDFTTQHSARASVNIKI
jgi:PKD repeat protein